MGNVKRIGKVLPPAAVAAVRPMRRPLDAWQRAPLDRPRDEPVPLPLHAPLPLPPDALREREEKPAKPQRGVAIYDM